MPDPMTLLLFAGAAIVLLIIPGPAVTYIIARSVAQGRRAGLVSAVGTASGIFIHVLASVAGVSAILASSAAAFNAVKSFGALFLILLGIKKLIERPPEDSETVSGARSTRRLYLQALLLNVLNPKAALFVLAFLPQFVDPARGNATLQLIVLGGMFTVLTLVSDGLYAVVAGAAGEFLRGRKGWARVERYLTGSVYIALGVAAAVASQHAK